MGQVAEVLEAVGAAELAEGIRAHHATIVAAQAELISLIAAFDAREAWKADGATSMANWLVAALRVTYATACEWVGLGAALSSLPTLAASFATGELSFESAAAAAALATGGAEAGITDEGVTAEARALPADLLEKAVRRQEQAAAQAPAEHPRASLRWWTSQGGWCQFRGSLPPEEAAEVIAALGRAETDAPDPATGAFDPPDVRAADALVALASTAIAADNDADRACVVVHVGLDALVSGHGAGELDSGVALPAAVVRRLACDGRIEAVLTGARGVVGIGRATRQVPPNLVRHLSQRDRGCRFPGCGRTRHLHAHHIVHWANGGPTEVTNMIHVCPAHHKLLHEGGWSVTGNPEPGPGVGDALRFLRRDGTPFEPHHPVPAADVAGMDLLTYLRSRQ